MNSNEKRNINDEYDRKLSSNWEIAQTTDGRIFYVNHQTKQTQWEHPITKKIENMSQGDFKKKSV